MEEKHYLNFLECFLCVQSMPKLYIDYLIYTQNKPTRKI